MEEIDTESNVFKLSKMTTRRKFIKQSTLLGIGAFMHTDLLKKSKYKLGLQLYTLNNEMNTDLVGTLKKVAALGYKEVETFGFNYGATKYYWNHEPKALKQILDDNGLQSISGHYALNNFMLPGKTTDDLKRYVDDSINGALTLKQEYIVWPWLNPELRTIEKFKILTEKLNMIGEQIKKANLQLAYHNHGFEFDEQNGQTGYDIVLNETDRSLVKMEMDIYWFSHSSKLPAHHYFEKYPGRFPLLHFKDMDKTDKELHTILGKGNIDFKPYVADYKLAGVKHIMVEQGNNYVPDAFDCIKHSAVYMKKNLVL
jgi:sugar phosphate isomerase/epimerase